MSRGETKKVKTLKGALPAGPKVGGKRMSNPGPPKNGHQQETITANQEKMEKGGPRKTGHAKEADNSRKQS